MRKTLTILFAVLVYCILLSGCGKKTTEEKLVVYSFSGENEMFSISNGVIVLTPAEKIFYGGDLDENQKRLSNVVAYSMTFYTFSDGEEKIILSNNVEDMTGGALNISGKTGKVSGNIITGIEIDELQNNFYFELKTINQNGEESEYQLQLTLTEITGNAGN